MCVIYVVEEHDQVLDLWRSQQASDLHILHLDAHCDMRGLLINRKTQSAFQIWDMNREVDQGNFLTHAIAEGRISSLRWVYSELGGRQNDVGTVKYESDITAWPYRWLIALRGDLGIPIRFEAILDSSWNGLAIDENLDIDWDFFASVTYPKDTIQDRVRAFLEMKIIAIPDQVYACYSPEFSHPSRDLFRRFIIDLSRIFDAKVVEYQPRHNLPVTLPLHHRYMQNVLFQLARQFYYKASLSLRKRGIY